MSTSSSSVSVRRRVCTLCQTAKRRCDQRLPRCSRCAQRSQDCVYPSIPIPRESSDAPSTPSRSILPPSPQPPVLEFNIPLSRFTTVLPGASPIRPVPVVTGTPNPWPLFFDAQGPANTAISRPAMDWGVSQLSSFSLQWVVNGICPFINTSLYPGSSSSGSPSLPPTLRDAFAVCAAYSMKNHFNAPVVLGIVESKSHGLLYDTGQVAWSPLEQLAALQALVMYQLIRWFDGDIRQRVSADEDEAALESWTEALLATVGQKLFERGHEGSLLVVPPPPAPGDGGSGGAMPSLGHEGGGGLAMFGEPLAQGQADYASTETVAEWRRFLFAESCRRTVIFAYVMRGIYAMAKQGYCHIGNRVAQMSFTGSSRIWEAGTAGQWNSARTTEPDHWVERMDFEPLLASARPEQVDILGILLAVTYKGPDVMDDWMVRRGGVMFQ